MNDINKGLIFLRNYGIFSFLRRLVSYIKNKEYKKNNDNKSFQKNNDNKSFKDKLLENGVYVAMLESLGVRHNYEFGPTQDFLNSLSYKDLIGSSDKETITWVIPSFNKGSGGHNTIFRFARYFELCGYKNIFLIYNADDNHDLKLRNEKSLKKELLTHFSSMENVQVIAFKNTSRLLKFANMMSGDIIIGTCWMSQLIVQNFSNFNKRFFFTQDKEDLFQASGVESVFINNLALNPKNVFISASKWLSTFPKNKKSIYFDLGVDSLMSKNILNNHNAKKDGRYKIVFYSRFSSPRRAVDLGWGYLDKLKDLGVDFEVHAFGQDIGTTKFKFPVVNHGVLSPYAMYSLISSCDLSIALSTTNYSLLPLEAASLGVISCDIDTESNRINYKDSPIILLNPYIDIGAKQIKNALKKSRTTDLVKQAESVQQDFNWIKQLEKISLEVLNNSSYKNEKVSVCIPTLNGGKKYIALLESLKAQKFVDIELHIIDSGSSDNTITNTLKFFNDADICKIDQSKFGHGKTRNTLVQRAKQNQVVFLTQDAVPMSELLLITLIQHCQKPKIFGSFCRHMAYPSHGLFVADEMNSHFDHMSGFLSLSDFSNDEFHAKKIKFFSNNCCAINRELLIKYPFEDVNYGEDQLWSYQMLKRGYGKAYINNLCVMHSHHYAGEALFNMTKTDMEYNILNFGHRVCSSVSLDYLNSETKRMARKNFASSQEIQFELDRNKIKIKAIKAAKTSNKISYNKNAKNFLVEK